MAKEPVLESKSFWEMAELAIAGKLASCQSCVEFFYFQSEENARAFLDSCASAGLVDKLSLLDLRGDMDPVAPYGMTDRQRWYDQAIYISAPAFRKQNLDAARHKIEGTKNAVYEAFHLYYEVLHGNNAAIENAYLRAVSEGKLRNSKTALKRLDVNLSTVAKLRLIKDGYRFWIKADNPGMSRTEIEKGATDATVKFVGESIDSQPLTAPTPYDHASELDDFVFEFLGDRGDLAPFWQDEDGFKARLLLLPVISELIQRRITSQRHESNFKGAETFKNKVTGALDKAVKRERKDAVYVAALSEVSEDLNNLVDGPSLPLVPAERHAPEMRP